MVTLGKAQQDRQTVRLSGVRTDLRGAFVRALAMWQVRPELARLGRPIVTEGYRSVAEQNRLYAQGRTVPGPVVTYKRGGQSKHNMLPARALNVAFLLANGQVSWSSELFKRFAPLMKAVGPTVRWGGDWPRWKDRPHFEV